jgi:hypothetical protein
VRHLARFRTILHRSTILTEPDKQIVEGYMQSYDSLLDSDPYIQQKIQQKLVEGEIQGLQKMALEAIQDQYPALMPLAKEKIERIEKPDLLRLLVKQIYKAPDEKIAQLILDTYTS